MIRYAAPGSLPFASVVVLDTFDYLDRGDRK
jgi:hypothetical protein